MACAFGDTNDYIELINMPCEFKNGRPGYRVAPLMLTMDMENRNFASPRRPPSRIPVPIRTSTPLVPRSSPPHRPQACRLAVPGPSHARTPSPNQSPCQLATPPRPSQHSSPGTPCEISTPTHVDVPQLSPHSRSSSFGTPPVTSSPYRTDNPELKYLEQNLYNYMWLIGRNREEQKYLKDVRRGVEREYADASAFTHDYMMGIMDEHERELKEQYKRAVQTKKDILKTLREHAKGTGNSGQQSQCQ